MARDRRVLGTEILKFIDGTEQEVQVHAVARFEMARSRRVRRKTILNKETKEVDNVIFADEEYVRDIIKLSLGVQVTQEDLGETETDLKDLYDKYFGDIEESKKPKSTDIPIPSQEPQSEE